MASGMAGLEDDGDPFDSMSPYYSFESTLGILPKTPSATVSTYDYVAALRRLKRSGWVREYTSVNSFVLSWLVEKVAGQPYPQVISERIWQNIGAEADAGIIVAASTGAPSSHGGIFSTLRDLARYGLIYTPSWRVVASKPVVSSAYLRRLQTGGRKSLFENRAKEYPNATYTGGYVSTYQWDYVWDDGDFFKAGFQGQGLYVSPARDLVIACFSSGEPSPVAMDFRVLAASGLFDK
jgi:CubicO group peptidase (beta-lactamase class C family)